MTTSMTDTKISVVLSRDQLQFLKLMLHVLEERSTGLVPTSGQDSKDLDLTLEMISSIEDVLANALLKIATVPFHSTLEKL